MECKNCDKEIYWDHEDLRWSHFPDPLHFGFGPLSHCGDYSDGKYAEPIIRDNKVVCVNCGYNLVDCHGTWRHKETGSIHCYFGTYAEPKEEAVPTKSNELILFVEPNIKHNKMKAHDRFEAVRALSIRISQIQNHIYSLECARNAKTRKVLDAEFHEAEMEIQECRKRIAEMQE